jgi:hypothetical protein
MRDDDEEGRWEPQQRLALFIVSLLVFIFTVAILT